MTADALKKTNVRMQCPHCGTIFLVQSSQKDGLCFNCGSQLDVRTMVRDKRAAQMGWQGTYEELLEKGSALLAERKYAEAATQFMTACRAAPDDSSAHIGLLLARTRHYTDFSIELPTDLCNAALTTARADNPQAADSVQRDWANYERLRAKYKESERREAEARRREQERRERARREAQQREAQAQARAA